MFAIFPYERYSNQGILNINYGNMQLIGDEIEVKNPEEGFKTEVEKRNLIAYLIIGILIYYLFLK